MNKGTSSVSTSEKIYVVMASTKYRTFNVNTVDGRSVYRTRGLQLYTFLEFQKGSNGG
jgi:hypothetical protein